MALARVSAYLSPLPKTTLFMKTSITTTTTTQRTHLFSYSSHWVHTKPNKALKTRTTTTIKPTTLSGVFFFSRKSSIYSRDRIPPLLQTQEKGSVGLVDPETLEYFPGITKIFANLCCLWSKWLVYKAKQYLQLQNPDLSLDAKAASFLVGHIITTAVVLVVLHSLSKKFRLHNDLYHFDLRKPFDLKRGWLLWAGIGLIGSVIALVLTGAAMYLYYGGVPPRKNPTLSWLLPFLGHSIVSTACVAGVVGVVAPILEEIFFRSFFMVSLTKWLPTPVSVFISSLVFAFGHGTPGQFPQLLVMGTVLGLSYARTRNLLTPITIHGAFNSAVILLLTWLKLQGVDLEKLFRESR